jgi:hypothetical protein
MFPRGCPRTCTPVSYPLVAGRRKGPALQAAAGPSSPTGKAVFAGGYGFPMQTSRRQSQPGRPPRRGRLARAGVCLGAVAGITLAAAGCSGTPVPYRTPSASAAAPAGTAAASPAASQSPLPAASGQLTGTQLQTVLLPQSSFPSGFALSSSSAVSAGASPASYDLATMSCASFVNHFGNTGFGESGLAANSYSSQSQAFDQMVYQFPDAATAARFVSGLQSLAGRCRSFTATGNGSTGTFSLQARAAAPVGAHPSAQLLQTGKIGGSPVTLATLVTVSGTDVFAVAAVGLGAAAPTSPATQALVYDLMKRQAAAAFLG